MAREKHSTTDFKKQTIRQLNNGNDNDDYNDTDIMATISNLTKKSGNRHHQ